MIRLKLNFNSFHGKIFRFIFPILLLFLVIYCSPISRKNLDRPKLKNGFEYYSASIDSMNSGAFASALDLVKEAIKLNPNYAKFYLLEGDVYTKLNDPQQALNSFFRATRLRSSYVDVYLRIASIYEKEYKNFDEAIKYYRKSYAVNKSNHNLLINIGNCYLSNGEIGLASSKAEEYKNIINSENKLLSFDYFYLQGRIYFKQKNYQNSKANLHQAVKINPNHFNAKLLLVRCLFETSNLDEGLKFTNDLLKIDDTVGELYFYRGVYYFNKNKLTDALGLFEHALSLDSSLLKSHYYLGKIHEALGNKDKSLQHLQSYRRSMIQNEETMEIK